MTDIAMTALPPSHRRWRDVRKGSLLLGLVLAPILPVLLGWLLMQMLHMEFLFGPLLKFCAWVLAAADAWSLIAGTAVLLLIARLRGTVWRGDCLLLGAGLAATLPLAASLVAQLIAWASMQDPSDSSTFTDTATLPVGILVVLSVLLIPFGAIGGWVFWRVGVYPAQGKVVDVAPVFD